MEFNFTFEFNSNTSIIKSTRINICFPQVKVKDPKRLLKFNMKKN